MASHPNDTYDYMFKIIIIGDSGVGKSSLLTRYSHNEFSIETKSTIGVEFATSLINIEDKRIKVTIWDTAGQERFRAATNAYYRNTLGAFIVYDLSHRTSFENVTRWLEELKNNVEGDVVLTLVGNKCDLKHLRAVTREEAQEFADSCKMNFVETSALDSINIESTFKDIITDIYAKISRSNNDISIRTLDKPKTVNVTIASDSDKPKKFECCDTN